MKKKNILFHCQNVTRKFEKSSISFKFVDSENDSVNAYTFCPSSRFNDDAPSKRTNPTAKGLNSSAVNIDVCATTLKCKSLGETFQFATCLFYSSGSFVV